MLLSALLYLVSPLVGEAAAATPPNNNPSIQLPQPLSNQTLAIHRNTTLYYEPPSEPEYMEEVDAQHALKLGDVKLVQPERDYYAAMVAAENTNMADFIGGGGSLRVMTRTIQYRRFGVKIYFDNPAGQLSYDLISDMLEALATFMWKQRVTEFKFSLVDMVDGGVAISNGGIEQYT